MAEETVRRLRTVYGQLKKQNNRTFIPVGALCVLYLLLRWDWLMCDACLALIVALAVNKKRAAVLEQMFRGEGRRFSEELAGWVKAAVSDAGAVGCGYMRREERFDNVLWIVSRGVLYLFALPVQAHFVYAVESEFRFIFSMAERTEPVGTVFLEVLRFRPLAENHQDFLREQAMGSDEVLVMQSFMYDQICAQALEGKLNGAVRMNDGIDHLRRETLFAAPLSGTGTLYVTERGVKMCAGDSTNKEAERNEN